MSYELCEQTQPCPQINSPALSLTPALCTGSAGPTPKSRPSPCAAIRWKRQSLTEQPAQVHLFTAGLTTVSLRHWFHMAFTVLPNRIYFAIATQNMYMAPKKFPEMNPTLCNAFHKKYLELAANPSIHVTNHQQPCPQQAKHLQYSSHWPPHRVPATTVPTNIGIRMTVPISQRRKGGLPKRSSRVTPRGSKLK